MTVTNALRTLRVSVVKSRYSLDDFIERWHDALVSCLPSRLRSLLSRRAHFLIVVPDGATARLYQFQDGEQSALGEFNPHTPGSLQAVLARTTSAHRKTLIRLAQDQVLTRHVTFPAQTRDNLAQVLGYEMDRLSPFRPDEVFFDFRALEDLERKDTVRIELALCRRDRVWDWLKRLRDNGAPVEQLTWEGAWPTANLLPAHERPQRGVGLFSLHKLMLFLASVLAAATLATPIWQRHQIREERAAQTAELKVRAEKVHEMRTALDRARQGSVAVLQRKWEQPRMIDLLLELTERLPDDTWVQNLDYQNGEIQIRGESAQATALINLLDQARGITEVTFRSPVVQVAGTGLERFHISLKYKRPEEP